MAALVELLGPSLVATGDGKIKRFTTLATQEALAGKTAIGLVFAADWSEESKEFAAALVRTCDEVAAAGHAFQVVLVSSDGNVDAFARFLAACPGWLALPYTDALKAKEAALAKRFMARSSVKTVPALVMLNPDGSVINKAAKGRIGDAAAFPWRPPTLAEALGTNFDNEHGDRVSLSALHGKYIGLYFGAGWCGPCRAFSRRLAEAYGTVQQEGGQLEVVYVSADNSVQEAEAQRRQQPWLQLPYAERWRKDALTDLFNVASLPTFVLLDADLRVVNPDARHLAQRGAPFPWLPRLVWDADSRDDWDRSPAEAPVLLVLAERAGAAWDDVEAAMTTVAKEAAAAAPPPPPPAAASAGRAGVRPVFMLARERQGLGLAVRRLARLGEAGPRPQAVLLDMFAGGTFYPMDPQKEISAANLRAFLAAYSAGALLPQAGGPVQTITVTHALTHVPPAGEESEPNPWETLLSCILCPITCPLMCAFQCCLGCCLFTALGAAVGASGMSSATHGMTVNQMYAHQE